MHPVLAVIQVRVTEKAPRADPERARFIYPRLTSESFDAGGYGWRRGTCLTFALLQHDHDVVIETLDSPV